MIKLLSYVRQSRPDVTWLKGPDEVGEYDFDENLVNPEEILSLIASFDENTYQMPKEQSELEEELIIKSSSYTGPGRLIADEMEKKIWARNTYLKSIGKELSIQQLSSLLSASQGVLAALRTGSLITAKMAIMSLKAAFPTYSDIGDWAIGAIEVIVE